MKIVSIGGGPAGLYASILFKRAFPEADVRVYERNRPDDTFGWGVVFSDETLGNFEEADAESYRAITEAFRYWPEIHNWYADECVVSTGHGFCGMSRKLFLELLQARCRELEIPMEFEREVTSLDEFADADLILGADGINSFIRETHAEHFKPHVDWRPNHFCWLGTDRELEAFTFIFRENEHGLHMVHAYPFQAGLSTFIVECSDETWKAAGLDQASEVETVAYYEALYADHLEGHRLLTNRSLWRAFPTISCERWYKDNVVLLGDAVHTAHFSIGSGTKLAMEDAIALVEAFRDHGWSDVGRTLAAYEDARRVDVIKLQKAAQTSLEWFENAGRYTKQPPLQFMFNLMTRSKRITWDNLALRDPALIMRVREDFAERNEVPLASDGATPEPMFAPYRLRTLELANRVVVSPMCQYSAEDGSVGDWHLVHLGGLAVGGAGLVMTEMTDVTEDGRISYGCAGIWKGEHVTAWKRVIDFCRAHSPSKLGIQLAHAGRKASCSRPWEGDAPLPGETTDRAWEAIGPSATPFGPGWPAPRAMDRAELDRIRDAFAAATVRALEAGFDLVELHMAHGYLLSSFLSPKSNLRQDEYGGSLENRMRYPLEVLDAVRAVWPSERPLSVRISASDWLDDSGGLTIEESIVIARALGEHGADLIDVSSAGNTPESEPVYGRMYQVPFAERIKLETGLAVMAVGGIQGADHVNTIVAAGRADLCALARPHLVDPHLTLGAAVRYGFVDQACPKQYAVVAPRSRV